MTAVLRVFLINVGLRRPLYPLATPPMGLLALAAYVRTKSEVEIRIVNQRVDNLSPEELARQAAAMKADIVGLSCFTTSAYQLGPISREMRRALPNALIVLGGPHASAAGANSIDGTDITMAVPGEGELSFEAIVQARREGTGVEHIPGLIWRSEDGSVHVNPGAPPQIDDLDALPLPAYDLLDMPSYWSHQSIAPIPRRRYISLVSSRGCPYGCSWCHKIFTRRLRVHSATRIVDEIEYFSKTYGVDDFEFLDDNFNFHLDRLFEFTELLKKRNLKVKLAFPTAVRGDLVTQEVVEALKDAGTYLCGFSLETGSPRLQKYNCKNLDIPKFLKAVEWTAAKRIYITGFCMMGFPTETEEELQQTIDVACASRFHTASFFTVTPFPGTPLYETVRQSHPEKLERIRYDDRDFSTMCVNLTDLPDEVLFAYQRKAMRRFFMNPRRLANLMWAYPQPLSLPVYLPIFLHRATKGIWKT